MDKHAIDAIVSGYEDLIPALHLPDPNDRHVLAAAIRGGADAIVTMNLRDFPVEATSDWGIEAAHPDEFVTQLFGISPAAVLSAAEYVAILERQGLRQSALLLREYLNVI